MKKQNKLIKRMICILLTVLYCSTIMTTVFATSGILGDGANVTPTLGRDEGISTMTSDVLAYVQWFGWAIAIGMIIYIGIKYMMAAANEKADLKNGLIRYVIGALIIGGASSIFPVIWSVASTMGNP